MRSGPAKHTIGVEFGSRVITLGGKTIKLQIWDTAGQERFRSVTRSYYRGAAGALIVYDLTDRDSFSHLPKWCDDARSLGNRNITVMLVGNKSDLKEKRAVQLLESSRFAQSYDAMILETSALTGEHVDEVFLKCARSVLNKIESGEIDPSTFLGVTAPSRRSNSESDDKRSSWCSCCQRLLDCLLFRTKKKTSALL